MAPRRKHTSQADARFFRVLETGRPVQDACAVAGYSRAAVYRRRAADAAFALRWTRAEAMAVGALEDEADRRGREGVIVTAGTGALRHRRRHYSDALLLARLKALKPDVYRDMPPAPPRPAAAEWESEDRSIRFRLVDEIEINKAKALSRTKNAI